MDRSGFVIVLTGPSGSGKSTFRQRMLDQYPSIVVASSDDMLVEDMGRLNCSYQEAYARRFEGTMDRYERVLQDAIDAGRSVIVDRTHLTPEQRAPIVARFQAAGYIVLAAAPGLDVKSEEGRAELLRRAAQRTDRGAPMPAEVVTAQIDAYQAPTCDEGFLHVLEFHTSAEPSPRGHLAGGDDATNTVDPSTSIIAHLCAVLPAHITFTVRVISINGAPDTITLAPGPSWDQGEGDFTAHQRLACAEAETMIGLGTPFAQAFGNIALFCTPVTLESVPDRRFCGHDAHLAARTSVVFTVEHDGAGNLVDFFMDHAVHVHKEPEGWSYVETIAFLEEPLPVASYDAFFARMARIQGPFFVWHDPDSDRSREVIAPDHAEDRHLLDSLHGLLQAVIVAPKMLLEVHPPRNLVRYA